MNTSLPVTRILPELRQALADKPRVLLTAPPGSGKTTRIPQSLLDCDWLGDRKIVMLAPRRLAARSAAARIAWLMGEQVGETVGYRVRMESRVSSRTRIEVVTEGVLTRRLQHDPALEDTGLVIFDEFHERSLDGDLGLAFCLDLQGVLNPELRILVMSATLEVEPLQQLLDGAPLLRCEGRSFPVETAYLETPSGQRGAWPERIVDHAYRGIQRMAGQENGSMLVFLPGAGEIRRLADLLEENPPTDDNWLIAPLYGNLAERDQQQAILPAPAGVRKLVLATNIAETSLTIEGVRVVIDSGLERRLRFDPRSSMSRLVTVPISQASAEQRRGRAGRTEPGCCLRLWPSHMQNTLPAARRPEILETDLCGLVLELAQWGVSEAEALQWLDPPPAGAFAEARRLLTELGALDAALRITSHGQAMARLPLHPRLAHMVLCGEICGMLSAGKAGTACQLAALLGERDPLQQSGAGQCDLQLRLELLEESSKGKTGSAQKGLLHRIRRTADELQSRLQSAGIKNTPPDKTSANIGRLLARAYPDRIAKMRDGRPGSFLLSSGSAVRLESHDRLHKLPWLVVAEMDGQRRDGRIYLAAEYSEADLRDQFAAEITEEEWVEWDSQRGCVTALYRERYRSLILSSAPLEQPDPEQVSAALLTGIRQKAAQRADGDAKLAVLPWSRELLRWRQRLDFLRRLDSDGSEGWPDLSDQWLLDNLEQWLAPFLGGITSLEELQKVDLRGALTCLLPYSHQGRLEQLAPTHLTVPSGSRVPVDYSQNPPVLAVRLQEMFGLANTPTIAAGRQRLRLHLLSPAHRPLQITDDLGTFWSGSYEEVKKEMRGRYPKHPWPDDPLHAKPTSRTKKQDSR